MYSDTGRLS